MKTLWQDFETYNQIKSIKDGTYEYARTARILLASYALDEGPVQVWDTTAHIPDDDIEMLFRDMNDKEYHALLKETIPDDLKAYYEDPEIEHVAHNAMFDRNVLRYSKLAPPETTAPERWRCTMVKALLHGFNGSLEMVGSALGLRADQAKTKDGKKLINRFCSPAPSNHKAHRYTRVSKPEEWDRFIDYAARDIVAMREIDRLLPKWNVRREEYHCDQRINDRGFYVDRELVEAGIDSAIDEKEELANRFEELTRGEGITPGQREKVLNFINDNYNLGLENTQAATLKDVLQNRVLPPDARELMEIIIESNKTSNSKYAALGSAISPDNRFRGGLQFSGAARTRRWCLTPDHEILTENGWVRLDQWEGGTIAQWRDGGISFEHADRVSFDYEGALITACRKNRIDAAMTPEHTLCVSGSTGAKTAGSAYGRHVTGVERHGVLKRKPISTIKTRILVMLQHDGYVSGKTVEWCFQKKRKITRCKKLLASARIPFTSILKSDGCYRIRIPTAHKPDWLVKRDFGPWLLQERHCPRSFIDEIAHWDGGGRRDKQIEVCSKKKINAEWTCTMAHLAGCAATVSKRANGYWFANVSKSGNRVSIKPEDWGLEPYKGKVYCAVTRTGFFLVRRNGAIHVTGNSGRSFQPQNLPSRGIPKPGPVEVYIEALKLGLHKDLYAGELMRFGSAAVRGLVIASPGNKLMATDLSNIEGRANAWLAGEQWKLDAFVEYDNGTGPDLYNVTASGIIGKDPYNINKDQRQIFGKIPDLACLAGDTKVLTDNGVKPLVSVRKTDRLWDGIAWVNHKGLVQKGVRRVVNVDGIKLTQDHLVLTGKTWKRAEELVSNDKNLYRALVTGSGNLPSKVLKKAPRGVLKLLKLSVLAALKNTPFLLAISGGGKQPAAINAQNKKQSTTEKTIGGTRISSLISVTGEGFLTAFRLALIGAETQMTPGTRITGGGVLKFTRLGLKTENFFSDILSNFQDGMFLASTWIGLMLTKVTNLKTYGLSPVKRTGETRERFESCNLESTNWRSVYDIAHAGPLNRFTVLSDSGFLIVHNCGYQGGVGAMQNFTNAYNIRLADYWESITDSVEEWAPIQAEANYEEWGKARAGETPSDEWIASETIKLSWRDRHPAIKQLWYDCENAAKRALENPGQKFRAGKYLTFQYVAYHGNTYLRMRLPSGNYLVYYRPKMTDDGLVYWGAHPLTKQWSRLSIYGGKFVENACQSLSRDILMENLLIAEQKGYSPILTVHDEIVCEVPDTADYKLEDLNAIVAHQPSWAKGFPLAADGFEAYRYKKDD